MYDIFKLLQKNKIKLRKRTTTKKKRIDACLISNIRSGLQIRLCKKEYMEEMILSFQLIKIIIATTTTTTTKRTTTTTTTTTTTATVSLD